MPAHVCIWAPCVAHRMITWFPLAARSVAALAARSHSRRKPPCVWLSRRCSAASDAANDSASLRSDPLSSAPSTEVTAAATTFSLTLVKHITAASVDEFTGETSRVSIGETRSRWRTCLTLRAPPRRIRRCCGRSWRGGRAERSGAARGAGARMSCPCPGVRRAAKTTSARAIAAGTRCS